MAEGSHPRIPTVRLDVPVITDSIAARLANTLFNHVLFLKSQVPLPVTILHKQRLTNIKADKPRLELLDTLDMLSSHLDTTFTALSTAYARCKGECWNHPSNTAPRNDTKSSRPTYLAILIGPSMSTAKTRVIFGVDGLEEKLWGIRNDSVLRDRRAEDEGDDVDHHNEEDDSKEAESGDEGGPEESDSDSEDRDEDEDFENEEEEQEEEGGSHSTVPKPPSRVVKPSQMQAQTQEPLSRSSHPHKIQTYADLQSILQKADRLFSNTLARAEGEGRGMSCEMASTQTHILLRAPRRFKHPAWIPRQNMGRVMERVVREFEEARGVQDPPEEATTQNRRKLRGRTAKVEGVWVTSSSYGPAASPSSAANVEREDEQNEMIWWSWEREVVGF